MEIVKFIHFLGLMMGAGAGIGHMVTAIAMKKTNGGAAEAVKVMKPVLGIFGMAGILLLWLSGIALVLPNGLTGLGVLFYLKLLAALGILLINIYVAMKMRAHVKAGTPPDPKLENLGKLNGPLALIAVALAVYVFN